METDPTLRGLTKQNLAALANAFDADEGYSIIQIPKRTGGKRTIFQPDVELDSRLKLLRRDLERLTIYTPPDQVHGFVHGRSIVTNARQHLAQPVVLCVDLLDYFPSISPQRVRRALQAAGLNKDASDQISRATTVQNQLPAGFSTSPWISNLVFLSTDHALHELCERSRYTYTRFADDLTFSGAGITDDFFEQVRTVLHAESWTINPKKVRFMHRGGPQYVTGLYVGESDQPHVPRHVKRRLRQQLHYMATHTWESAWDRGDALFHNQAYGWISYIQQVEPKRAQQLRRVCDKIDFSNDYLYWSDPSDWDGILEELKRPD